MSSAPSTLSYGRCVHAMLLRVYRGNILTILNPNRNVMIAHSGDPCDPNMYHKFRLLLQIGLSVQPCFVLQNSLRHVNQGAHVTSFLFWLLHRPFIADTVCRAASAFPLVFSRLLLPYAQRAAFCVIKLLSYCDIIAVCATVRLCA